MKGSLKMTVSDAQKRATEKWNNEKVDSIRLRVPKGKKELIKECANKNNESINGMINRLIDQELKSKNIE